MSLRHIPLRWGIARWSKMPSLLGLMIPAASAEDGTVHAVGEDRAIITATTAMVPPAAM